MLSICPSCKKQLEHEDFLFEVVCDNCRTRFNPFMQQMEVPAEGIPGLTPAASEPSQLGDSPAPAAAENFSESNAVFQELRQFGETLEEPPPAAEPAAEPSSPGPAAAPRSTKAAPTVVAVASDCAMTTGDTLHGYTIETYLDPVSLLADIDAAGADPLKGAFEALSTAARNLGANGLLGLRWVPSSDMSRVMVSGIPVRCTKQA